MDEKKYVMSQKGYDEAVEKLVYLQTVKRQEIVERIAEARSHGDLSENAEYEAARNEQATNELEIAELDYKIKNAVILKFTKSPVLPKRTLCTTKFPTNPPLARLC